MSFAFEHRVEFVADDADRILRDIVAGPGVFALRGEREGDQPYLTRAADVRRRLRRLLTPPEAMDEHGNPVLSKRLNLRERVRWIEWTATGSEFASILLLYCATRAVFGAEQARKRLRLYPPYMLRVTMSHRHPRVYVTNRLSPRGMGETFGPFASRAAAERYSDAVLDLFKLRRCHEDLQVHPEHPGCAYGEMKKCHEPCKGACSEEVYAEEAEAVQAFFATRGESMLAAIGKERENASEAMDFERAAELHKQFEKVKAAAALADELVRPVGELRAVVLQTASQRGKKIADPLSIEPAGQQDEGRPEAAVFLLERGQIVGPERLSTLGVRAVREQTAVGSSLFAQPLMLAAVPLESSEAANQQVSESASNAAMSPEERARGVIARLEALAAEGAEPEMAVRGDFLALFRRWYYRPEKQRAGEVFLPNADGSWPLRRVLNAAARVVLGPPRELPAVDREAAAAVKTKVIHPGREGVERVVPVLPKRARTKKTLTPGDLLPEKP